MIVLLILSSCSNQKTNNIAKIKSPQHKVHNLTKKKLSNATYFQFTGESRSLTIGPNDQAEDGSTLYLLHDQMAFGDLRGDGEDYAVVFLAENGGGSGVFISLNAIVDSNGSPYHLASFSLGDRIGIDTVFIQDRIIHVNAMIQSGNHGAFPDSSASWQFILENNDLKEITGAKF